MKPDTSHIKKIEVVSNTHWDREFRRSFEKTRRNLIAMMDTTLDILENDPCYHSFTMDGHSIMIDDYLEMKPEKREQIERFVREGRLIIGPYYTLSEEFSISHEPIVRNLIWGGKTVEKYGGKTGTVAYTPSSWGQTGQLPQILSGFGIDKVMFYRGISHHEADAEYIWSAPDGTRAYASRFALYARYNWYYQVHRAVMRSGRVFSKDYVWGEYDETPMRLADTLSGDDQSYDIKAPALKYDVTRLKKAIEDMVEREGTHYTTELFLAMHGHDISAAHPLESKIIKDAQKIFNGRYEIIHTDLESYWAELIKHLDTNSLSVLSGERRAYLKEGMWTFLFPGTISARTYLKQKDFDATTRLVYYAEPLASLAYACGTEYPVKYLERGWKYLLSNHTHDANGGCAPDVVCKDMEYRYRKVCDIGDIVTEDSMTYIASNLSPEGLQQDVMQLIIYNPLPFERDAVVKVDLEVPRKFEAKSVSLESMNDGEVDYQPISFEKSSAFMDSIWDVPTILESNRIRFYAGLKKLPALGYRVYTVKPEKYERRISKTLVTGADTMENKYIKVTINPNGAVNILNQKTGKCYENINYLTDQGECGNAWKHVSPRYDRKYNSLGVNANISIVENGPVSSTIAAEYKFFVPTDYADGNSRNTVLVDLPVRVEYRLRKDSSSLEVTMVIDNKAKDHWLRANFPTGIVTNETWADSHFDVLSRPIPIPDSTGWVEEAGGTHPLRTFVDVTDGINGIGFLPKGIYEYEAFEDEKRTLALTLIRACRIKLAVSEEKQTELPDTGIQCSGIQRFEYAVCVHDGDWNDAGLLNRAADYYTPIRCAMSGRGKGNLPYEASLFALDNRNLHITCVKQAEDGNGLIIRLFNPLLESQTVKLIFGQNVKCADICKMDESILESIELQKNSLICSIEAKKIMTFRIVLY